MIRVLSTAFAPLMFLTSAAAQFELPSKAPASRAEMISEAKTIAPGATFSVALKLEHPEGWHSYYQNSGGVELPPVIEWKLPEGFTAGPIQWPAPEVKEGFFGKSFVFTGSPVFITDLTAPKDLANGETVTLTAHATWQICEEACINEDETFTLTLPVGIALEKDPAVANLFAEARARQPAAPDGWEYSATSDGGDILLRVEPATPLEHLPTDFVPDQPFVMAASAGGSVTRDGDAVLVRLPRATRDALDNELPQGDFFSGVILGPQPVKIPETVIAPEVRPRESVSFSKLLPILGGMMLGGLILNLMPCVFPVIGLKIMGFVQQAGADRKKIMFHGVIFTLGVLASFAVLSGILFAARAASGAGAIGWGYQLQNPWVVLGLMLLMFLLALNMFGVFEIGASATSIGGSLQSKHGISGSFFSGVLATVVATPCSAPFLGAAIGAAVGLPAVQFFAAFGAMALGLAMPYLILSIFPRLIDFLPRPGAWMISFKQAMSFLLFATAGFLLWVYAGLIGLENLLGPLFGLSAIAVAAWIHGRWNLPHFRRPKRLLALLFTLLFAAAGFVLSKPPKPSALTWETWSEERVEALLDDGKPIYIDFTAQWCATCQVNKKRAYTPEVIALMEEKGVVALKADKTKPDPEIEAALQKLGRSAIPVNVLLTPGGEPVIFSELLSPDELMMAIGKL
jgi:DsbC/DsbD-like thiol-disulfide interchange protein/cytochrome c biogenesis protein CcdA/thiol-disulfide isomerase/thioredoxin